MSTRRSTYRNEKSISGRSLSLLNPSAEVSTSTSANLSTLSPNHSNPLAPNAHNDFRFDDFGQLKNRNDKGQIIDQRVEHRFERKEHVRMFLGRLQQESAKELNTFDPEAVVNAKAKARSVMLARTTDPSISASLIVDPQLGKRFHHLSHLSEAQLLSDVNADRVKGLLRDTYSPPATSLSNVDKEVKEQSSPTLLQITPAAKHHYPLTVSSQQRYQKQVSVLASSIANIPTGEAEVKFREERRQKRYNGHISDAIRPASDVLNTFWVIFGVGAEHRVDFTDNIMRRHTIETYEMVGKEIRRFASRSDAYGTLMRLVALRETLLKALLDCARNPLLTKDKHTSEKQQQLVVDEKQNRKMQASLWLFGGKGTEHGNKLTPIAGGASRPSSGLNSTVSSSAPKHSTLRAKFRRVDILQKCAKNSHQIGLRELEREVGGGGGDAMNTGPYANGVGVMAQLATIRQQQQVIDNTIAHEDVEGGDTDGGRGYTPMQPVGPKDLRQKGGGESAGGERLTDANLNSVGGGIDKPLTYSTHENLLLETLILITHLRHVTILIVDMVQYERKCCRDLANSASTVNTAELIGVNGANNGQGAEGKLLGSKNDVNKLIEEDLRVRRSIAKRKAINKNVFEAHFKGLGRKEREAEAKKNGPSAVEGGGHADEADKFERMLEKHRKQQELEERAERMRNAQRGLKPDDFPNKTGEGTSPHTTPDAVEKTQLNVPRKRGATRGNRSERPHQAGDIPLPLTWDGTNYLIKMKNDLAPLDDTGLGELLRNVAEISNASRNQTTNAFESCSSFTFANNPFILATKRPSIIYADSPTRPDGSAKPPTGLNHPAHLQPTSTSAKPSSVITINLNGVTRAPFDFIQKHKEASQQRAHHQGPRLLPPIQANKEELLDTSYMSSCEMLFKEDAELIAIENSRKFQREHLRAKNRLAAHRTKLLEEKEKAQIGMLRNQIKQGASVMLPSSVEAVHSSNASWQNSTKRSIADSVLSNFPPFIPEEDDEPDVIELKRQRHYYAHQRSLNEATTAIVHNVTVNSRHIPFERFFLTQILEKEEGIGRGAGGIKRSVGSGIGSLDAAKKRLLGSASAASSSKSENKLTVGDIVARREKELAEAESPLPLTNNANTSQVNANDSVSSQAVLQQHRGAYIPATHLQHYFDQTVKPDENINLVTLREDGTHTNRFEYPVEIYFGGERPVWERTAILLARSLDVDFMKRVNDYRLAHSGTGGGIGPSSAMATASFSPAAGTGSTGKKRLKGNAGAKADSSSATDVATQGKSIHPRQIVMNKSRFKFTIAEEIKAHLASDRHRMFPPSLLNPTEDPVVDSSFHCYNVSWPVQQYTDSELREREAAIFAEKPVETNRLESAKRKFQRALYKIKMALSYFRQVRETKKGKRLHLAALDFKEWMVVAAPGFAATVDRDLVKWFEPLRDQDVA